MTRRRPAVALLGLLLAGCGISGTEPFTYGEPLKGDDEGGGVQLHFVLRHATHPVLRPGAADLPLQDRLDLLAAGPTDTERAAGLETSLRPGVRLSPEDVGVPTADHATVRVDGATLDDLDPVASLQIACTVGAFLIPAHQALGIPAVIVIKAAGQEEVVKSTCPD